MHRTGTDTWRLGTGTVPVLVQWYLDHWYWYWYLFVEYLTQDWLVGCASQFLARMCVRERQRERETGRGLTLHARTTTTTTMMMQMGTMMGTRTTSRRKFLSEERGGALVVGRATVWLSRRVVYSPPWYLNLTSYVQCYNTHSEVPSHLVRRRIVLHPAPRVAAFTSNQSPYGAEPCCAVAHRIYGAKELSRCCKMTRLNNIYKYLQLLSYVTKALP